MAEKIGVWIEEIKTGRSYSLNIYKAEAFCETNCLLNKD
jgi:hypothetical protein